MARLYPPAYQDDPIRNLEFERIAGDDLTSQRLASIGAMEASIDADRLSGGPAALVARRPERPPAGARHAARDHGGDDRRTTSPPDDPRAQTFALYAYLTWLVDAIVGALSGH